MNAADLSSGIDWYGMAVIGIVFGAITLGVIGSWLFDRRRKGRAL